MIVHLPVRIFGAGYGILARPGARHERAVSQHARHTR